MSIHRKPNDLVAFAVRNPEAENADECEGERCSSLKQEGIYSTRCQRKAGHVGKHWSKEYGMDGDGSITTEWQ